MTRNSGSSSDDRNPDGTFAIGNPGKPKGSRHKATKAVENLLEGQKEALTQAAIDKALEGDAAALRLCLERIAPVRKDAPICFDLPPMDNIADASTGAKSVVEAVSSGEITPLEGASVMALIEGYRKTLETADLERRVSDLENAYERS